jgi:hypothetical protein
MFIYLCINYLYVYPSLSFFYMYNVHHTLIKSKAPSLAYCTGIIVYTTECMSLRWKCAKKIDRNQRNMNVRAFSNRTYGIIFVEPPWLIGRALAFYQGGACSNPVKFNIFKLKLGLHPSQDVNAGLYLVSSNKFSGPFRISGAFRKIKSRLI